MYANYIYEPYPRQFSFDANYLTSVLPEPIQQHQNSRSINVQNILPQNSKSDRDIGKPIGWLATETSAVKKSSHYSRPDDKNSRSGVDSGSTFKSDSENDKFKQFVTNESKYFKNNLAKLQNKIDAVLLNQKQIISKIDHLERSIKLGGGNEALNAKLVNEIRNALNIDFDIDLEVKPDDKMNKFTIKSIKEYKVSK